VGQDAALEIFTEGGPDMERNASCKVTILSGAS